MLWRAVPSVAWALAQFFETKMAMVIRPLKGTYKALYREKSQKDGQKDQGEVKDDLKKALKRSLKDVLHTLERPLKGLTRRLNGI